ncbi:MAG: exodeoxyribonuclease V subunit gamma, partial [Chitinivibrionales bacterium]
MSLGFYCSNSLERLAYRFSEILKTPPETGFFTPDIVVNQTSGMSQWLALKAAENNSVIANTEFLRPQDFFLELYKECDVHIQEAEFFFQENMKWRIFFILRDPEFMKGVNDSGEAKQVLNYVKGDPRKRFEISAKTADIFDQYMTYRPEIIRNWIDNKLY